MTATIAGDDGGIQKNGPRLPMNRLPRADHAAMGWSHGQYKDGYCFALMSHDGPEQVAAFRDEALTRGAEYVDLCNLPEYLP